MAALAYTAPHALRWNVNAREVIPSMRDAERLGQALKRLRLRLGLTQAQAAAQAGTYQQTWARYEAADNDALLKVTLQRRLAQALGASHADLLAEAELVGARPGPGESPDRPMRRFEFPVLGRVRAGPQGVETYDAGDAETFDLSALLGPDTRILRLAGESMIPYAEPGGFVSFNTNRFPRRGQGCVIETHEGVFYVKRFERTEGDKLIVTELHPVERELTFDLRQVRGVYAVGLRGD